jgi:Kef-type K+ transport system membrane component KefB
MSLNDVQLLLADVAIIIILARLLGAAARRLGQPPVLGEILAGILLGPTFWGPCSPGETLVGYRVQPR